MLVIKLCSARRSPVCRCLCFAFVHITFTYTQHIHTHAHTHWDINERFSRITMMDSSVARRACACGCLLVWQLKARVIGAAAAAAAAAAARTSSTQNGKLAVARRHSAGVNTRIALGNCLLVIFPV